MTEQIAFELRQNKVDRMHHRQSEIQRFPDRHQTNSNPLHRSDHVLLQKVKKLFENYTTEDY